MGAGGRGGEGGQARSPPNDRARSYPTTPGLEGPGFLVPESSEPGQGASAPGLEGDLGACALNRSKGGVGWGPLSPTYLHVAYIRRGAAGPAVHVGKPVHAGGKLHTERCAALVIGLYLVHRHRGNQRRGVGG